MGYLKVSFRIRRTNKVTKPCQQARIRKSGPIQIAEVGVLNFVKDKSLRQKKIDFFAQAGCHRDREKFPGAAYFAVGDHLGVSIMTLDFAEGAGSPIMPDHRSGALE